jgi:phosphoribosylaminoimidazolecarboxamide formyltransferase / IMP cyclohydrolase
MMIKNALISATDKDKIKDFAVSLSKMGVNIYSTRGTKKFLEKFNIKVNSIEEYINFPEILGGRVKTLNPKIFGGILAKETKEHLDEIKNHDIKFFDIVCVDLYNVKKAIEDNKSLEDVLEHIDIGGISLIRAAAKGMRIIVSKTSDMKKVIKELEEKAKISEKLRKELAAKAFLLSSSYDKLIYEYLFNKKGDNLNLKLKKELRYGENPHQKANFYDLNNLSFIDEVLKGNISYNNLLDIDGASNLSFGLDKIGYKNVSVIVKHGSPSGVGVSDTDILDAFSKAWELDSLSSFGGVLCLNKEVREEILPLLKGKFIEVIVAPSFTKAFLKKAESRKKLKIVKIKKDKVLNLTATYRSSCGGILKQDLDPWWDDFNNNIFENKGNKSLSEKDMEAIKLSWAVVSSTKSNSIVVASSNRVLGIGAGCVSRIDATKMALTKARRFIKEGMTTAIASDAFFPFSDSVEEADKYGIKNIVEPGGSIRDSEVIDKANKCSMGIVFTNKRHFRH